MDAGTILAQCGLFAALPPPALRQLAALCEPLELRGGDVLFGIGQPAEHLYLVALGRLRARLADGSVAGDIARLEPAGEISLLSGEPHSAEVHAVRDSLLLRLPRAPLLEFLQAHPATLLALTRTIVQRMRRNQREAVKETARRGQTLALIGGGGLDVAALARRLQDALAGGGAPTELIGADTIDAVFGAGAAHAPLREIEFDAQRMAWVGRIENSGHTLLLHARAEDPLWAERCLRQADRILVAVDSAEPARDTALLARLRELALRTPVELLILRPEGVAAGDVQGWRRLGGARAHYFLRPQPESADAADWASLARQLSGRGLGLVLGGGGARGFAHIGLMRALEQLRIPVDLAGGTSMGAFFAALRACGADSHEMLRVARETFVEHNYLNDYVLPRVSLIRGRKFLAHLRAIFGEQRIEELRLPYFAVSTNLSRATTMVHDSGPLAVWIGTSMSVPGFSPPVAYRGELLVDGAVTNSLPTDVMLQLGRGPIVASDVSTDGSLLAPGIEGPDQEALLNQAVRPPVSLIDILFASAVLTSESGVRQRASRADLYLRMPVSGIGLFDWKQIDAIVERCCEYALPRLEAFGSGLPVA
ncbi:patatin-like phospholipase family protein [Dokdonella ginsengisoli]|uniref:Patatin-like phospholipase family protein n=1 Tax=Dokdonella ginsengisoli TaxID=363846 RepID=A0ABV9QRA2_9GAMM